MGRSAAAAPPGCEFSPIRGASRQSGPRPRWVPGLRPSETQQTQKQQQRTRHESWSCRFPASNSGRVVMAQSWRRLLKAASGSRSENWKWILITGSEAVPAAAGASCISQEEHACTRRIGRTHQRERDEDQGQQLSCSSAANMCANNANNANNDAKSCVSSNHLRRIQSGNPALQAQFGFHQVDPGRLAGGRFNVFN